MHLRPTLKLGYWSFKVRGPFVETVCIEKDSYIDAILCENSFKLCLFYF